MAESRTDNNLAVCPKRNLSTDSFYTGIYYFLLVQSYLDSFLEF